jgi:hypothetical protein
MAMSDRRQHARFGIDAVWELARQLYAQHFWNTERAHSPIALSVLKLYESLQELKQQGEFNIKVDMREDAFVHLTEGLAETLAELDVKSGTSSGRSDPDIDIQPRAVGIQECQKRIGYFATTTNMIVEALRMSAIP